MAFVKLPTVVAPLALGLLVTLTGLRSANAQNLIKNPTAHPHYSVELEPHLALDDAFGNDAFGVGMQAAIPIVDPGFVSTINNSVAIGFGLDWMTARRYCAGPYCYRSNHILLPVVMQWNFWFTPNWSAFGEPGLTFHIDDDNSPYNDTFYIHPAFEVGGRYNFNDKVALTLRVGVPVFTFGASFFL
ncbi:MAG TPA: hypothetical protein VL137_00255 [Polyangiaceae bacterium]|jgi:hypothetical protein|nr:hypothetical protein [Polyangiaceae bacterium]